MRAGDSTMVRSAFADNPTMATTYTDKQGKRHLKASELQGFLDAVGTPHDEVWDEKIWSYDVNIDGNLATAWTDYTFYAGENMSHCGVNAFHLFHSEEGWKIFHLADTRTRQNCQTEPIDIKELINSKMEAWHKAAATADEDVFFGLMSEDGIYLGTDANEKWLRDTMARWAQPYFEKDVAWAFTTKEREVYVSRDGNIAWFDEVMNTWMGECRGSGVWRKTGNEWELTQYNLAILVPNDKVQDYLKLFEEEKE